MKLLIIFALLATAMSASTRAPMDNILEEAKRAGCAQFYDLVQQSSIKSILTSQGPFTLFAPSDEAIANFDPAELVRIVSDPSRLNAFIGFHAGFGRLMASQVTNDALVTSLAGYKIRLNVYKLPNSTLVTASGSAVSKVDFTATNGVVHVVNSVLYPPPTATLLEQLLQNEQFSLIYGLIYRSDLVKTLESEGPFTLFAPTDRAVQRLSPDELIILIENRQVLNDVLKYHTVAGTYQAPSLVNGNKLEALNNQTISVAIEGPFDSVLVNGAEVNPSLQFPVTNGVVHGIDSFMGIPEGLMSYTKRMQDGN